MTTPQGVEALQRRLADYQRDERGRNVAEVVYWRQQYKQLATDAIAALAVPAPPAQPEPVERLRSALELMWDRYENGDPCHDSDDPVEGSFIGNAVRLFEDEEREILSLIPAIPIQSSRAFPMSLLAHPSPTVQPEPPHPDQGEDAALLDWLERAGCISVEKATYLGGRDPVFEVCDTVGEALGSGPTLRAAISAARKEQQR